MMSRKRHPVWRTLLVMLCDVLMISVGLYFAYWLRFKLQIVEVVKGYDPDEYLKILPWAVVIWFFCLRFENLYRRRSRVLDFNVVRRIVTGSLLALLVLLAINFYLRLGEYSRVLSIMMPLVVIGMLVLGRIVLHYLFQWMMIKQGIGQSRTIVLGSGQIAARVCQSLERHPEHGMKVVGIVLGRPDVRGEELPEHIPVLGMADELDRILAEHRVAEVIMAQPELDRDRIPELLVACERAMAVFRIVPETQELLLSGMTVETLDGIPLLGIRETPLQGWNAALKRMIDFVAALIGLIVTAPIVAFFALLVWVKDRHNPFYMQERMGIDGQLFKIIKLRSMRVGAEGETGPTFATDYDPRCTALGGFLRRTHLDELPQLINVLRGEMSLVGPRPERPYFIDQFRDNVPQYMARHRVKSGITGWAQVNGLCGLHGSISERLNYDLYYIENWSLWLDIKIVFMTLMGWVKPGAQPPSPDAA